MTNTTTTTSVATLKKLNKECLKIDLNKVEYKVGLDPYRKSGELPSHLVCDAFILHWTYVTQI
jgi:hypothetical protein